MSILLNNDSEDLTAKFLAKVGAATQEEIQAYLQLYNEITINAILIKMAENKEIRLSVSSDGEVVGTRFVVLSEEEQENENPISRY